MAGAAPSIAEIRARFPALAGPMALLENAGGSQVPLEVADAIRAHMLENYVQLGAGYAMSDRATRTVDAAHEVVNTLMNGTRAGKAILGASTTQLIHVIAGCAAARIRPGDEIVIAESGHEANIGPWLRLERAGAVVRWWRVDPDLQDCPVAALDALLTPRTRWVVFPHVSNLLGAIVDVEDVTRRAHAAGARVFVDGVAYAPHRAMDVERWGVDWYAYSTYKVYGPHMGAVFGTHAALAELEGPNHFFIPRDQVPYTFELGGASHEGCAAIVALAGYLAFLAGNAGATGGASAARPPSSGEGAPHAACASAGGTATRAGHAFAALDSPAAGLTRAVVEAAFARMTDLELPLQRALVEGVRANPALRLVGPATTGASERVPTVSLLHRSRGSAEVARQLQAAGCAVRCGHMYAHRLCRALGIGTEEGVVRISAVHYNTPDEVERAVAALARYG